MATHALPPNPTQNTVGVFISTLPPKPTTEKSAAELGAASVSAAPQLRDLKKEATAFVPTSLKRKKPGASTVVSSRVDAAPSVGLGADANGPETIGPSRPDLLNALKDQFGPLPPGEGPVVKKRKNEAGKKEKKDDYEKFVEDVLSSAK